MVLFKDSLIPQSELLSPKKRLPSRCRVVTLWTVFTSYPTLVSQRSMRSKRYGTFNSPEPGGNRPGTFAICM